MGFMIGEINKYIVSIDGTVFSLKNFAKNFCVTMDKYQGTEINKHRQKASIHGTVKNNQIQVYSYRHNIEQWIIQQKYTSVGIM